VQNAIHRKEIFDRVGENYMKILFTGGGSGGHFYPIIAVAEAMRDIVREKKLIEPELYYAAPDPYDRDLLFANGITFVPAAAGKMRRDASAMNSFFNFFDLFKTAWGVARSLLRMFFLYPDVVLGSGGYASFPTLLAARIFRIPVVIYATDAEPSRVNLWAGKFATKIAISFPEAAKSFPKDRVAYTGNPIRKAALLPAHEGVWEFLHLNPDVPVILVVGGSQGSQTLNEGVLGALPALLPKYQIIHQTGEANIAEVQGRARVALAGDVKLLERYKPFGYLNDLAIRMSAGAAALVVARGGAGTIFEIAAWGLPSIIVPIPEPLSHDQVKNAFSYARSGAAVVIEQNNFTPGLLVAEVNRIFEHKDIAQNMAAGARTFARVDAARTLAQALLDIGLSHEL
jgi:UDP-N-acetylglucosamine--N-acetylmuramyl-(pentapeptide) pyrophosphoryl-undecaprenol N-acetylglucosamine transferase